MALEHHVKIDCRLNWELLNALKERGFLVRVYEKNGYALYRFNPERSYLDK